jgi:hypothetical protein
LLLRDPASSRAKPPMRRSFDRPANPTSVCMELFFGMGWMRFDHSKSGLLAADRTPVFDTVLKAHVTSFPPGLKAMTAPRTAGSLPGGLAMGTVD